MQQTKLKTVVCYSTVELEFYLLNWRLFGPNQRYRQDLKLQQHMNQMGSKQWSCHHFWEFNKMFLEIYIGNHHHHHHHMRLMSVTHFVCQAWIGPPLILWNFHGSKFTHKDIKQTPSQIEVCFYFYLQVWPNHSDVGHLFMGILVYIRLYNVIILINTNTSSLSQTVIHEIKQISSPVWTSQPSTMNDLRKYLYLIKNIITAFKWVADKHLTYEHPQEVLLMLIKLEWVAMKHLTYTRPQEVSLIKISWVSCCEAPHARMTTGSAANVNILIELLWSTSTTHDHRKCY